MTATDALLAQAIVEGIAELRPEPKTAAERKAAQRARARDGGRCIICCVRPVPVGRTTCAECVAIVDARRARRAAKSGS